MDLPDFLLDDSGFIRFTAHRIGLHHVVRDYNDGYSPEMIAAHYPSVPLALVHKAIAFYLENRGEVDAYVAEHDREIERQMALLQSAPTLAELRRRVEIRRRVEAQAHFRVGP